MSRYSVYELIFNVNDKATGGTYQMSKLIPATLIALLLFLSLNCQSQQPVIEVKSFKYTWLPNFGQSRVIIATDDSAKLCITNSFATAIKERWNIDLPENSLTVKGSYNPEKFKTNIKRHEPGKWYLFMQVYENLDVPEHRLNEDPVSTVLELMCRLVNAANDSVIFDRTLTVDIREELPPPDQVPLTRLPAYPPSFIQGFDTIAKWLFQQEPVSQKTLHFKPACMFQKTEIMGEPVNKLSFKRDLLHGMVHQLTEPAFSFQDSTPKYERIGIQRNTGGRLFGQAFTLMTGIDTDQHKYYKYKADYQFKEKDSIYHCFVGFIEDESAEVTKVDNSVEVSDFMISGRHPDPNFPNVLTLGTDTLARFTIKDNKEASLPTTYDRMWDGKDSTTIIPLPTNWTNKKTQKDIVISGNIGGNSFKMKTMKETRIKDFYIDDQLMITFHGHDEPVSAFVFQPITMRQLKIFTILSLLPYSYFSN
jgi:hypothetical protein